MKETVPLMTGLSLVPSFHVFYMRGDLYDRYFNTCTEPFGFSCQ